jgi:hypothetical protein
MEGGDGKGLRYACLSLGLEAGQTKDSVIVEAWIPSQEEKEVRVSSSSAETQSVFWGLRLRIFHCQCPK